MATLVAIYVHGRIKARCDARCYEGISPQEKCKCLCGGDNHGVGVERAVANTLRNAARWKRQWNAANPSLVPHAEFRVYHLRIATQLSFFPEMERQHAIAV